MLVFGTIYVNALIAGIRAFQNFRKLRSRYCSRTLGSDMSLPTSEDVALDAE